MPRARYDAQKVATLADQILHHKQAYYAGHPEITDEEYDRLEDDLRRLAPDHPVLQMVGAPVEFTSKKVRHDRPMLSLQKTYKVDDLHAWKNDEVIVGTIKVDGNSLSIVYEDGSIAIAKTRGNGRIGEDVTEKVAWVPDAVPKLSVPNRIEVRGELFCTESRFVKLSDRMAELGYGRPTSPRNIVAGLLGRKANLELMRFFNFLAFDVVDYDEVLDLNTEMEKFAWLESQGFKLPCPRRLIEQQDIEEYLEYTRSIMEEDEMGVDGAVFSFDRIELHKELGFTSHHPRFKMVFKWQGRTAESVIQKVSWATSRLGVVTPVAVIDPVNLSGAKITNVTLHNAAHVKAYNLKEGDRIEIVRSGEVIPKFLQVLESAEGTYAWPECCPSCASRLIFDDVRLKCPNTQKCPAQLQGAVLNWIRSAGIDDLSEKRLRHLMDSGLVRSMTDLYRLKVDDFYRIPQTKEKMANKLFKNIQNSRELSLVQFLNGLGIEGAGSATWEKLLEVFPSLEDLLSASADDIGQVDGFAEKTANQIASGLEQRRDIIEELLEVGVRPRPPRRGDLSGGGPLAGMTLVITGALSKPRGEVESVIKAAGGKTASSVSKNTTAVITNEPESTSSKMRKARQLEIPVWSETELQRRLAGS